jgi:hypothetical protein
VVLLHLARMRASEAYNNQINVGSLNKLVQEYGFSLTLGDQVELDPF